MPRQGERLIVRPLDPDAVSSSFVPVFSPAEFLELLGVERRGRA